MNKLKTMLSRILVFAMLLSVFVVPTAAAEMDFHFSAWQDPKPVSEPITMATYYKALSRLQVSSNRYFIVSSPDREYTLTNTGENQNCYLVVSATKYTATTAGQLREQFKTGLEYEPDLKDIRGSNDALVYFAELYSESTFYLTPTGTWRNDIEDGRSPLALRIRCGQTATFTLPEAEDNDIFALDFLFFSTDDHGAAHIGVYRSLVLVDTDGIHPTGSEGSEPAPDFKFPTFNTLSPAAPVPVTASYTEKSLEWTSHVSKTFQTTGSGITVSAPADQEYTLVNTGNRDLIIKLWLYENKSASELRKLYYKDDIERFGSVELPDDDTPIPFFENTLRNTYYLTTEIVFQKNFSTETDQRILCMKPGETVTFKLPEVQEGQLCRLVISPKGSLERSYSILISNDAKPIAAQPFTDVPAASYYADSVLWAVERGITTGTSVTTFSPADTCTTAQILTFLWRAKGEAEPNIENPFSDVTEDKYYYNAALWAFQNGLVEGDTFNGAEPCRRASVVMYLWKLAGSPEAPASSFADVASDAEYAKAVDWAVEQGITNGTSATEFSPNAICTRAQIVTLLYRALGK